MKYWVFLLLGIWDVMSNEEVVDFVRSRIAKKMSPELVCFVEESNIEYRISNIEYRISKIEYQFFIHGSTQ